VDFDAYQNASRRTLNVDYPQREQIANAALGLAGEAGEIADLFKKYLYHGHPLAETTVTDELGDILWYVAAIASLMGISLDVVAQANIDKLWQRYPNGFSQEDSLRREDVNGK